MCPYAPTQSPSNPQLYPNTSIQPLIIHSYRCAYLTRIPLCLCRTPTRTLFLPCSFPALTLYLPVPTLSLSCRYLISILPCLCPASIHTMESVPALSLSCPHSAPTHPYQSLLFPYPVATLSLPRGQFEQV